MDDATWLRGAIAQVLQIEATDISTTTRLVEDLDADSVDLIEIANIAESEFDITIDEANLYDVNTVGELAALIERVRSGDS